MRKLRFYPLVLTLCSDTLLLSSPLDSGGCLAWMNSWLDILSLQMQTFTICMLFFFFLNPHSNVHTHCRHCFFYCFVFLWEDAPLWDTIEAARWLVPWTEKNEGGLWKNCRCSRDHDPEGVVCTDHVRQLLLLLINNNKLQVLWPFIKKVSCCNVFNENGTDTTSDVLVDFSLHHFSMFILMFLICDLLRLKGH